jgi:hypothetical protein
MLYIKRISVKILKAREMNKKIIIPILAFIAAIVIFLGLLGEKAIQPVRHLSVEKPIDPNATISMVVTFPGEIEEWTIESINKTYNTIRDAGIRISHIYYSWGEIEKKNKNYKWDELDFNIRTITKHNMQTSLVIKIIDTDSVGQLPEDITFVSFDSPLFKERFKSFILALLDRYRDKIEYLWIGNEIDGYFYKHRDQFDNYVGFYEGIYLAIKEKYPKVKVGTISTFHDAKRNQALDLIEKIGKTGDLIGFSVYPQGIKYTKGGAKPSDIETILSEISSIANRLNKKFAITETSWSTAAYGGSEGKQTQYIKELFGAYKKYKDKIKFLGLFVLYDLPESINRKITAHYGIKDKKFFEFQASLGLAHNNGDAKKSWDVFLKEMKKAEKPDKEPLSQKNLPSSF